MHVHGDHLPSTSSAHRGCADHQKPSCSARTSGPCWKRRAVYTQRGQQRELKPVALIQKVKWPKHSSPSFSDKDLNKMPYSKSCKRVQKAQPRAARIQHRHLQSRIVRTPCIERLHTSGRKCSRCDASCCAIIQIWHGSIFSCLDPACTFPESSHGHHRLSRTSLQCKNVPVPQ